MTIFIHTQRRWWHRKTNRTTHETMQDWQKHTWLASQCHMASIWSAMIPSLHWAQVGHGVKGQQCRIESSKCWTLRAKALWTCGKQEATTDTWVEMQNNTNLKVLLFKNMKDVKMIHPWIKNYRIKAQKHVNTKHDESSEIWKYEMCQ